MYTVYYRGVLIHDPSRMEPEYHLLSPKYSSELGKVDSFSFSILPNHPYYTVFERLQTGIVAYRDGVEIFRGRILSTSIDLNGEKQVECEGNLSYLLDSLQPRIKEEEITCEALFRTVIANHNALVEQEKQFTVGQITATKRNDEIRVNMTAYTASRSVIDSYLLKPKGGYLRTRYVNGVTYIDWIQDFNRNPNQVIKLGVNMMSFQEEISADDFYTVLLPTGTEPASENDDPDDDDYGTRTDRTMTIESVNDGSPYIELTELVQQYGRIYKTESYSEAESPAELLQNGMDTVNEYRRKLKRTIEVGALDLHYIDSTVDMLMVGDHVEIVSIPHSKDETLVVTKVDWEFNSPENDKYSFGDGFQTLTKKTDGDGKDTASKALKAASEAKSNSANLRLVKNRISIEANNMDLTVKDTLDAIVDTFNLTFKTINVLSTEYTERDPQQIRADLEQEWQEVTRKMELHIESQEGRANFEAISNIVGNLGSKVNRINSSLDSDQGYFSFGAFSTEYSGFRDQMTGIVSDYEDRISSAEIILNGEGATIGLVTKVTNLDGQVEDIEEHVSQAEIAIDGANAAIALKANTTDVTILESRVSQAEIDIDGANAAINLKASQSSVDALSQRMSSAELVLDGANGIAGLVAKMEELATTDSQGNAKIKAASIVAEINRQTGQSQVKISADQVNLDGVVAAQIASIQTLNTNGIAAVGPISATGLISTSNANGMLAPDFVISGTGETGQSVKDAIKQVQIVSSGNDYTLQKKSFSDSAWQTVGTFSRATTLNWSWGSGGTFTVTASPQGNTKTTVLQDIGERDLSWNGNTASFWVYANLDGGSERINTGKQYSIDASARYNAGYSSAKLAIDSTNKVIQKSTTGSDVVSISATAAISYNSSTHKYTATGIAKAGSTQMDSATATSGTDAYTDGLSDGRTAAGLSYDVTQHKINRSPSSNTKSYTMSASGSVGSYDSANSRYPVTCSAVIDGSTTIATGTAYVYAEPLGSYAAGQASVTNKVYLDDERGIITNDPTGAIELTLPTTIRIELGSIVDGKQRVNLKVNGTTVDTVSFDISSDGTYTQASYAKQGLTSRGYRALYYYSDSADRYVSASGDNRSHYWYTAGSSGWDTLYQKTS